MASSSFHLTTSSNCLVVITDYRKLKIMSLQNSHTAQHPCQISLISAMSFSIHEIRADGYHL
jgi:hypothetical protein